LKRFHPLLLLLAGLLILAACGGEPTPEADDGTAFPVVTVQFGMASVKTATPVSPPPGATVKATATWVPLPSPSPTVDDGLPSADDVPRIGLDEARSRVAAGEAVFVDVRAEGSYDQLHIAGALWLPVQDVAGSLDELPADKLLIFYCA
jgi:hypothetical protein